MVIRIRDVSKRYDENVAVDGLSLEVAENKLFGLIGPNGAGKTTTLKMLATLVKPDHGDIEIHGLELPADVREVRRRVGYMPDAFGTFRGLTCFEYLHFFGCCHGLRGRELTRQLSAQFDNFLYVTVNGAEVHVDVRTVGAMTTDKFSPQQWRLVNEYDKNSLQRRLYKRWGSKPSSLFNGVLKISAVSFLAGLVLLASLWGLRKMLGRGR